MEKVAQYCLNGQVKAIQKELGEGEDGADLEELEKITAAGMSKEALTKAQGELKKLRLMSPMSAEARSCATPSKPSAPALAQENPHQQGSECGREGARYLRTGEGQGTHCRIPCRATTGEQGKRRFSAWLALRGSARRHLAGQSIARRPTASSCAWRSVASVTRPKSAATAAPTSGSMPGKILNSLTKVGVRNPLFLLDK